MRAAFTGAVVGSSLLLAVGCTAHAPRVHRGESRSARFITPDSIPVITQATVVAFWLATADTIPETARLAARDAFRRSNAMIADYLSDTDILLVATVNDTVVIQLANGVRRVVQLTGLDFPYGYVLIEPGYAEEFHTGLTEERDLQDALDDYFGLESDTPGPKHRIAQDAHSSTRLVSR
jgi:hypothetical protein